MITIGTGMPYEHRGRVDRALGAGWPQTRSRPTRMEDWRMFRLLTSIVLALITVTGCGRGSDKLDEIKQDQREILFRLGTLTKEIEQAAARAPAAADAESPQPKALDIVVGDSPVKGPHDARVTIVEFSDFQCPACKTYDAIVNQVLEQYPKNVRLAYKQFP